MLREDELKQLPTNEALKHVLIQAAGSLKQAYHIMDVSRTGFVSRDEFEVGLRRLNVRGARIAGFGDASSLYRLLDQRNQGQVALQDLLGYYPIAPSRSFRDTGMQFFDYANQAAAQRSRLARAPLWKQSFPDDDAEGGSAAMRMLGEDPDEWEQRRRDLRRKLRETKGNPPACGKRAFVAGLVDPESYAEQKSKERNQAIMQEKRIKGALGGMSRARSDLVGLQQAMKLINPPERKTHFMQHRGACADGEDGGRPSSISTGPEAAAPPAPQRRQSAVDVDVSALLSAAWQSRRASAAYFVE